MSHTRITMQTVNIFAGSPDVDFIRIFQSVTTLSLNARESTVNRLVLEGSGFLTTTSSGGSYAPSTKARTSTTSFSPA